MQLPPEAPVKAQFEQEDSVHVAPSTMHTVYKYRESPPLFDSNVMRPNHLQSPDITTRITRVPAGAT